jgi:hypothetical protein
VEIHWLLWGATTGRKESWYLLRFLRAQSAVPWLCARDFNEVLAGVEPFGTNDREQWQMDAF